MTKFSLRRKIGRRILEFAAGDYHAKYVPDSPFLSNPLLVKAKAAALKKTEGGVKYTPRNVSAEAQNAVDELKRGAHSREISKYEQGISPLAAIGRKWAKEGMIDHANPHVAEAYQIHEKGLREIKRKHQDEINRVIIEKGGGIHAKSYPPGWKVQGRDKLVPTLHESWTNYAISVNDQAKHTEYLARKKVMKDAGETIAHAGVEKPYTEKKIPSYEVGGKFYPESVIREGGLEKGSKAKLTDLTTAHRHEVLSNKGEWKGYKSELLGSRSRVRQRLAEELGMRFHPTTNPKTGERKVRIESTGKRQIIQAQRRLTSTPPRPVGSEFWKKLEASKSPNAAVDPFGKLPLGSRPNPPTYQTPVRKVGLAGAGPEEVAEYGRQLNKVESSLSTITKATLEDRTARAARLKGNLQKKTDVNIGIANPKMNTPEVYSRREVAVNELLHGSATPPKEPSAAGKLIEGEQLARHSSTIGITPRTAKRVRTEYRNLVDTSEHAEKQIRKEALGTPGPFVMEPPPTPNAGPKYPHLKKLGIGLGVGAGVIGGAYLLNRWRKNRQPDKEVAQMSSAQKLIYFATRRSGDQRTVVSKDRYTKNIKNQDLADAISNYTKSAAAGAGLGYLLRKKGGMPLGRALKIGAVGGLVTQAGTRAITSGSKDQFGERSWQGKYVDQAPAATGAAVAGGILVKRHLPKIWHTLTQFSSVDPNDPDKNRPVHDIATGTIEGAAGVLATDKLIKKFAPSGSGVGRKLFIGGAVGGAATGGIGFLLNRLVEKKIAERRQQQQMSSRQRLIQFIALTEDQKEQNRQVRRWSGRSLKTRGEEIYQWGGRAGRVARDIKNTVTGNPSLDSRGRPRKKEWEKPYAWKLAATTAIGLGLTGVGLYKTKTGQSILTKLSNNPVGKFFGGVRDEMSQLRNRAAGPTVAESLKVKKVQEIETAKKAKENRQQLKDITGMKSRLRSIQFAENLDYWDARDLSRNQAVVTAPGGQRRHRRQKTFTERKAVRDALFTAGIAGAGAIGWGTKSWVGRYKAGLPVIGGSLVHAPEQLHLPLFNKRPKTTTASDWVNGHLDPAFRLSSRLRLIRFEQKKRDYATPVVGAASGVGGIFAGGMYRGRSIQPGEDLTGRRVTRPHNVHPLLQHEGVGVAGGKIAHMHYTPDMGKDAIVKEVTPAEFSGGKTLKVLDKDVSHEAARRAQAMVGSKTPYSLFYNNCQRFGVCARTGSKHFVPRQLKTALIAGGIAAGVGGGATKGIQTYRNRKTQHNFAAQDDGGHPWVRRSAEVGGLGLAATGAALFPGSRRMMGIAGRELFGKAQTALSTMKGVRHVVSAPKEDPNKYGKMVYNYIDSSQHLLNRGVQGKVTGKVLQAGLSKPDSLVGKIAVKAYPGHFGPGHFARFRASHLEALKHWDYEYGKLNEDRLKGKLHPVTKKLIPLNSKQEAFYKGRQQAHETGRAETWNELNDALHNKGMNEEEALHHVATKTQNPHVQNYFKLLGESKQRAAMKYAKLGTISPGLMAIGGGTAGTAYAMGQRKEKQLSSLLDDLIQFERGDQFFNKLHPDVIQKYFPRGAFRSSPSGLKAPPRGSELANWSAKLLGSTRSNIKPNETMNQFGMWKRALARKTTVQFPGIGGGAARAA